MPATKSKPALTHLHITADRTTLRVINEVSKGIFNGTGGRSAAIRFLAKHYVLARRSFTPEAEGPDPLGNVATGTR